MKPVTDVQAMLLEKGFRISKVGITDVKKPIRVKRGEREIDLTTTIDVFVDLPATHRGSHMSRNAEIIHEVVDNSVREPVPSLEDLAEIVSIRMLQRHEYAAMAEVSLRATYFLDRATPSGRETLESYGLLASAKAERNGQRIKMVGVEVVGMNACPCAMETMRNIISREFPDAKLPSDMPLPSHNQRNTTTFMLEVPTGFVLEAEDMIDMVEEGMSSPTYDILKRDDEAEVVYRAHTKPMFVEDIVRNILSLVIERYPELPDTTKVMVKSQSEESIHKHNAMAERITDLGELRA